MTDILYIVRQSGWGYDDELRYALRAMEKNARNLGRIFVCGDIPDFLNDNAVKIPCDNPYDRKAKNLQYRLQYAIDKCGLGKRFLLSADDVFLNKPTDLDKYPHYWKNGAEISVPAQMQNKRIGKIINGARVILQEYGLPLNDYGGGHVLHWIDQPAWFSISDVLTEAMNSKYGVPVDLLAGAAFEKIYHPEHTIREDLKFDYVPDAAEYENADCFSIGDRPDLWGGDKWLQELYPNKSKYEK